MRDVVPKILNRWALALILLAAMGLPATVEAANGMPRDAVHGDLSMRVVRVLPDKGVISAYEPVIVEVEVTNISTELVGVFQCGYLSARLEVRDHLGRMVGELPIPSYLDLIYSSHRLVPGQKTRSAFLPSAVYIFKKPGNYRVKIMLLGNALMTNRKPSDLGPIVAEVTIPVSVQPFDGKRLNARCKWLIEPDKHQPLGQHDFHQYMMALWSVQHNAALPTLKFVAVNWGESSYAWPTAEAILRIGTPESVALLKALKSRKDRMGRTARSIGKTSPTYLHASYFTGWTNVISPEATVNEFLYYFRHRQWAPAETLFNDYFRRRHAAQLKDGSLFTNMAGKSVQSILNDPRSKSLRSRKEGKFVIVDVGQEAGDGAGQTGIVRLQLIGYSEWRLSDFPGSGSR